MRAASQMARGSRHSGSCGGWGRSCGPRAPVPLFCGCPNGEVLMNGKGREGPGWCQWLQVSKEGPTLCGSAPVQFFMGVLP